jgi:hypothetical protein
MPTETARSEAVSYADGFAERLEARHTGAAYDMLQTMRLPDQGLPRTEKKFRTAFLRGVDPVEGVSSTAGFSRP